MTGPAGRWTRERAARAGVLGAMGGLFLLALVIFVLPFAFPTPPPIVTRFQSTVVFSPDADGRRDIARVNLRLSEPSRVTLEIASGDDTVATLLDDRSLPRGWRSLVWDGRADDGAVAGDGTYAIRLRARAGDKRFNTSRTITVDTTAPSVAAFAVRSATLAGPAAGECRAALTARDAGSVLFEALPLGGGEPLADRGPLPAPAGKEVRWGWRGLDDDGRPVPPGPHVIRATLSDAAGNRTVHRRSCWVGRLAGAVLPARPSPGMPVRVALRRPGGAPLPADMAVALEFRRRTGTPGEDLRPPLGARVGPRVGGRAGNLRITTPAGIDPRALWLVARTRDGLAEALIPLGRP